MVLLKFPFIFVRKWIKKKGKIMGDENRKGEPRMQGESGVLAEP